jgi:hypothetical protein
MFARVAPLLLVMCVVLGLLWVATTGGERRSADFEAELARIERAQPQPEPPSEKERQRELRNAKKVRSPGGGWYYLPRNPKPIKRTATAAVDGCSNSRDARGERVRVPQPPGVTARYVRDGLSLLVTYRVGDADAECRPTSLRLTADVSDDVLTGDGDDFRIADEAGQIELPLQGRVVNADVLHASSWAAANGGLSSQTTTIRIRSR